MECFDIGKGRHLVNQAVVCITYLLPCRALLLKEALEDICKDKRNRYEAWRRQRLAKPKFGTKVRRFVITTVLPVAIAVYVAQRGVDVEQV